MAVSNSVAAGIGVACAAFTFIISFPAVLWLRRWFLRGLPPDPPNPYADEDELLRFGRLITDAVETEGLGADYWDGKDEALELASHVGDFVAFFTHGDGSEGEVPYDSEKFHRLSGGPHEDWDNLPEFDHHRRRYALIHFICRVLYLRMIPDGDCSITILPADMLSTYQRMLTKLPPAKLATYETRERCRTMLRQYWRALTVFYLSEDYTKLDRVEAEGSGRPNAVAIRWWRHGSMICNFRDDDPRMANILAVEALLKDALQPFWVHDRQRQPDRDKGFECAEAKEYLRIVTCCAADLALRAFSQPCPTEFYWPPTSQRREGPDPYGHGGYLQCFGARQRKPSPGSEYTQFNQAVTTERLVPPIYNDTGEVLSKLDIGTQAKYQEKLSELRERKEANNGEETEHDKIFKEQWEREMTGLQEYARYHEDTLKPNPGWDGATNFF